MSSPLLAKFVGLAKYKVKNLCQNSQTRGCSGHECIFSTNILTLKGNGKVCGRNERKKKYILFKDGFVRLDIGSHVPRVYHLLVNLLSKIFFLKSL